MGDRITAGPGASIVNRVTQGGAGSTMNLRHTVTYTDPGVLAELTRVVEQAGSARARNDLAEFTKELQGERPQRRYLELLFESLRTSVPALNGMADLVAKVQALLP